jgi:phage-related protein
MPSIGPRCHELRVRDEDKNWRIIYRIDADVVAIIAVFAKDARQMPKPVIDSCKLRLTAYDEAAAKARGKGG